MTCIVGIADGGKVFLAGDRGASTEDTILASQDAKIVRRGSYLVGYAGNYGLGQLMLYGHKMPPARGKGDLLPFMRTQYHRAFSQTVEKSKYKIDAAHDDTQSSFLIGIKGQLFEYEPLDGQMAVFDETAIGAGAAFAFGSLFATRGMHPEDRVRLAVAAACRYSPSCCGPIDVLVV